ncbi:hypothetical protein SAMN02982929_04624 [Saccharopolyspora kobensis]|uniref:Uncharacterized protein n=1 Tax=Saccharopolyspora kobensis TaxID=146035 RepID=A0A1H6DPE6_9PSEU|nr:hypothetical protein [Saccharopolyspora kobensis]SEG86516.1 hypothetical protein SAMN02982929_04624 [Saccharopolyspora kobensis]SFE99187.1 hypothetical protein SAMN05216506_11734 [Saccharopolyspora kobensis]
MNRRIPTAAAECASTVLGAELRACTAVPETTTADRYLMVRFEATSARWHALADVLVLPEVADEGAAHQAAVAALDCFPGCAATVTKVDAGFLAHTRRFEVLRFHPPSTAENCADRVHAWLLSAGGPEDRRRRSDSACGPPICS